MFEAKYGEKPIELERLISKGAPWCDIPGVLPCKGGK